MNKSELLEIKKGKTGTGLLIEHDGYISMSDKNNKFLKESFNSETGWHCPYPFIVHAVFQKYGIKNANGRIYPENVLKKQVEIYQERINEKRALGECYSEDAMILTNDGWKNITEVREGELILTLNTETNEIEVKPIIRKIEYDYVGDMVHIKNRNIDDLVTLEHKYPIYNRYNKFKGFFSATDILNNSISDMSHSYIPKQGIWVEKGDDIFTLSKYEDISNQLLKSQPYIIYDKKIKMSSMMKLLGIYLSEGCLNTNETIVYIYQKKEEIISEIKELMIELDLNYSINVKDNGVTIFNIYDARLAKILSPLGDCYHKYIPKYFKNQSKENLKILYEWFVKGDRRIRGDKRNNLKYLSDDVFSSSKQLILDLNEIQFKIGYSGNYHFETRDYDRYIEGRLIEGKNTNPLHFTFRSKIKGATLDKRFLKVDKEFYKGKVYCVEVENHTWYVMQNNKCHWTGNCNHPSESTIDLGRISHNIIELHWEGRTLVGQMELNVTKGFVEQGICSSYGDTVANLLLNGYKIGVSSRGVGSVEQKMGQYIVGDDFELICWDIVSDPSTPNAYIGSDREELEPYMESTEKNKTKLVNEKINKLKNILSN